MFLEMVSHSTGKHKTQLEGTGSGPTPTQVSYLMHISSAMTSPFHLSFLPALTRDWRIPSLTHSIKSSLIHPCPSLCLLVS